MRLSLSPQRTRSLGILLLCLAALLSVTIASIRLGERLAYELQGPFTADTTIYWAVGRGILNGLTPYRDLFETKPPGIFLLSALSFLLTGDARLAAVMQTAAIILFPVIIVVGAFRAHRAISLRSESTIVLSALSFGIALALYTAERSGEFQTESFGALFVSAYAAVIAWDPRPLGAGRIALASLMLFFAIGLKEPFVITALAVAILLAQHPRDLVASFVKPALFSGLMGLMFMGSLGFLEPYLNVYLPEMLGKQFIGGGEPLWLRGLHVERIAMDINAYSGMLAAAIGFLIAPIIALRLFSHRSFAGKASAVVSTLCALYLLSVSVSVGGEYWNHHFVFAVPGFAALFFVAIREARRHWSNALSTGLLSCIVLVAAAANFTHPDTDFQAKLSDIHGEETVVREQARAIDLALDRCGIDRYLFLGGNGTQPYAFTRHSPMGPLFLQYEYWLNERRPEFRQATVEAIEQSFFAVVEDIHLNTLTNPVQTYLDQHFDEEPWPCADGIRGGDRFRFLYRKSGGDITASL